MTSFFKAYSTECGSYCQEDFFFFYSGSVVHKCFLFKTRLRGFGLGGSLSKHELEINMFSSVFVSIVCIQNKKKHMLNMTSDTSDTQQQNEEAEQQQQNKTEEKETIWVAEIVDSRVDSK